VEQSCPLPTLQVDWTRWKAGPTIRRRTISLLDLVEHLIDVRSRKREFDGVANCIQLGLFIAQDIFISVLCRGDT
jgi:hypothetical protein